jgi:hypothetical protein
MCSPDTWISRKVGDEPKPKLTPLVVEINRLGGISGLSNGLYTNLKVRFFPLIFRTASSVTKKILLKE